MAAMVALAGSVAACGDLPTDDDGVAVTIPADRAVVVPFQYRDDEAQARLQLRIVNHSNDRFAVDALRLKWSGLTTPEGAAGLTVVPGQTVDLPVPLADASCGDDPLGEPPSLAGAVAELLLDDGTIVELPVVDAEGVAGRLWRNDCERQWIESQAAIAWTDLHAEAIGDDPIARSASVATLRIERGGAEGDVVVSDIAGTVMFIIDAPALDAPSPDARTLAADDDVLEIEVTFVEARCDPHAFAETKQPVSFAVHLTIGGVERAIVVQPTSAERDEMMTRLREGCDVLTATGATQWWEV